jgi:hypothetical protein
VFTADIRSWITSRVRVVSRVRGYMHARGRFVPLHRWDQGCLFGDVVGCGCWMEPNFGTQSFPVPVRHLRFTIYVAPHLPPHGIRAHTWYSHSPHSHLAHPPARASQSRPRPFVLVRPCPRACLCAWTAPLRMPRHPHNESCPSPRPQRRSHAWRGALHKLTWRGALARVPRPIRPRQLALVLTCAWPWCSGQWNRTGKGHACQGRTSGAPSPCSRPACAADRATAAPRRRTVSTAAAVPTQTRGGVSHTDARRGEPHRREVG